MIGVLIARELDRAVRGRGMHVARWTYGAWLVVVLYSKHAAYYADWLLQSPRGTFPAGATADFAHSLVDFLVFQQTLLVLLITPSFAAGALTDEKVRGTLEALFLAHLSPFSVVLGKLIARILQGLTWSLAAWPVIAFVGVPGGVAPVFFLALAIVTVLSVTGTCAFSLLMSVWTRTSRDAVVSAYIVMVVVGIGVAIAQNAGPSWEWIASLNPNFVLDTARDEPDYHVLGHRLLITFFVWTSIAATCTAVAGWRLRPAYIKQLARKRSRIVSGLNFHPPVGNRPIVWKEQYVSRMPRWFGWLAVAAISIGTVEYRLWAFPSRLGATEDLIWLQWWVLFFDSLAAGLRGSAAIVAERDRKTWESLLSAPDEILSIVNDKTTGIVNSIWPFWFAAVIPAGALLSWENADSLETQTFFFVLLILAGVVVTFMRLARVPWVPWCGLAATALCSGNAGWFLAFLPFGALFAAAAMRLMVSVGIWVSAKASSGWISLLSTVAFGYAAAAVLVGASTPLACFSCCFFIIIAGGVNRLLGISGSAYEGFAPVFWGIGCLLALWWGGTMFRNWAVTRLERTERVPNNYIRMINLDEPYIKSGRRPR